jgi:tRNA (Thr-GGU) A37 N-methylase
VESCFKDRRGTPRQGYIAPGAVGRLRLSPWVQPKDTLQDIEGFSYLWIIFVFHENTNMVKAQSAGGTAAANAVDTRSNKDANRGDMDSSSAELQQASKRQKINLDEDGVARDEGEHGEVLESEGTKSKNKNGNSGDVLRVKAKVHPPRLKGKRVGLFSTRTPHRPNPSTKISCGLYFILFILCLFKFHSWVDRRATAKSGDKYYYF